MKKLFLIPFLFLASSLKAAFVEQTAVMISTITGGSPTAQAGSGNGFHTSSGTVDTFYGSSLTATTSITFPGGYVQKSGPLIYRVTDYGFINDGVTGNDAAWTKLIAIATTTSLSGANIYFSEGSWAFANELQVPSPKNISIFGADRNTTFIKLVSAGQNGIHYLGGTGGAGIIQDIQINAGPAKTAGAGIFIDNGGVEYINRVAVAGQFNGIVLSTANNIYLRDILINNPIVSSGTCVQVTGNAIEQHFDTVICNGISGSQPKYGFEVQQTGAIYFHHVEANSAGIGMIFDPTGTNQVNPVFISDSVFDSCNLGQGGLTAAGLVLNPASGARVGYIQSVNNSYSSNGVAPGGYGIDFIGAGTMTDFSSINDTISNNGSHGIHATGSLYDFHLVGDRIFGNSQSSSGMFDGVSIGAGISTFTIVDSEIGFNGGYSSVTQKWGVEVLPGGSNFYQIIGNNLRGNINGGLVDGGTGTDKQVFGNLPISNSTIINVTTATLVGPLYYASQTLAQLQALSPTAVGQTYYCSNCVTDSVCVSTGTGTGAFVRMSARGTACQ